MLQNRPFFADLLVQYVEFKCDRGALWGEGCSLSSFSARLRSAMCRPDGKAEERGLACAFAKRYGAIRQPPDEAMVAKSLVGRGSD